MRKCQLFFFTIASLTEGQDKLVSLSMKPFSVNANICTIYDQVEKAAIRETLADYLEIS
jgi:hypothetical protein